MFVVLFPNLAALLLNFNMDLAHQPSVAWLDVGQVALVMKAGGTVKEGQGGTKWGALESLRPPESCSRHLKKSTREVRQEAAQQGKKERAFPAVEPESHRDTAPALRETPKSCNKNRTTSCSPCRDQVRSCMLC